MLDTLALLPSRGHLRCLPPLLAGFWMQILARTAEPAFEKYEIGNHHHHHHDDDAVDASSIRMS